MIGGGTRVSTAYAVAVKNGFRGTETEWLASLKGEKGKDGLDGASVKGDPGPAGTTGYLHMIRTTDANGTDILTFPVPYVNKPNIRLTIEVASTIPYYAQFAFMQDAQNRYTGIGIRTFRGKATTLGATLAALIGQVITPHELAPSVPVHIQVVPV